LTDISLGQRWWKILNLRVINVAVDGGSFAARIRGRYPPSAPAPRHSVFISKAKVAIDFQLFTPLIPNHPLSLRPFPPPPLCQLSTKLMIPVNGTHEFVMMQSPPSSGAARAFPPDKRAPQAMWVDIERALFPLRSINSRARRSLENSHRITSAQSSGRREWVGGGMSQADGKQSRQWALKRFFLVKTCPQTLLNVY
jgi:hypothetical protein